jgi:hypothetical protein
VSGSFLQTRLGASEDVRWQPRIRHIGTQDHFGAFLVEARIGRIGTYGRLRRVSFGTEALARKFMDRCLAKRRSSVRRDGAAYVSAVQGRSLYDCHRRLPERLYRDLQQLAVLFTLSGEKSVERLCTHADAIGEREAAVSNPAAGHTREHLGHSRLMHNENSDI